MACICRLLIDFIGLFRVLLWYVLVFVVLVCMICLWCVVLLCVASLVCSACVVCCCAFVFGVAVLGYGLNALPVCECILYVPSLRCYFLFV